MTLLERLNALGNRRECEGIYTDTQICQLAIDEINSLRAEVERLETALAEGCLDSEFVRLRARVARARGGT